MKGTWGTVSALTSRRAMRQPGKTRQVIFRIATNIVVPVVIAVTTAIGIVSHGAVAVYWYLGTVFAIVINGLIGYSKDRTSDANRVAAIRSETDLATALNDTGQPLVAALGRVTSCDMPGAASTAAEVLIDRAVSLSQTVLASTSASRTRATFYSIEQNRLVRKLWHGWAGSVAPRLEFVQDRSEHDNEAVKLARGEDALLVVDLENLPPPHFVDSRGRPYKSFVAVPVRAGNKSYGLLTADSDNAYALTANDRGFLILIAGILGAGVAHVEAVTEGQVKHEAEQTRGGPE